MPATLSRPYRRDMRLGLAPPRTPAFVAVVAVAAVALAVSLVVRLAPAQAADPVTETFVHTGAAQSFVVPTGVSTIHVVAIGGKGATSTTNPGGKGGRAEADVQVTGGQTLTVMVGGNGGLNTAGAFNGGGGGKVGGGGASDVRTIADSFGSRVVTAGGGGGSAESTGGQAGADGDGQASDCAGKGATTTAPGAGGGDPGEPAVPGSLGQGGGDTGQGYGGGGGGGVHGGGQGSWIQGYDPDTGQFGVFGCGGGGGSSGFGAGITGGTAAIDSTGVPKITITYTVGTPPTETTSTTTTATTTATTPTTSTPTTTVPTTSAPTTATTTTSEPTTSTTTPATTPPATTPPAQPALVALKASRRQVGTAVKATAQVGVPDSAVKAKLTYKPKVGKSVKVGTLAKAHVPAGSLSLKVALNKAGKVLLRKAGKIALVLTVAATPPVGSPVAIAKPVTLKAGTAEKVWANLPKSWRPPPL